MSFRLEQKQQTLNFAKFTHFRWKMIIPLERAHQN